MQRIERRVYPLLQIGVYKGKKAKFHRTLPRYGNKVIQKQKWEGFCILTEKYF
jgi:hypothetical protein